MAPNAVRPSQHPLPPVIVADTPRSHIRPMPRAHDHGFHDHPDHEPASYDRAFAIGLTLNLAFVLVEAAMGVSAGSLTLLADAGHNLSDVGSLLLSWGALSLSARQPSRGRTYGYRRASILASLANAILLLMVVGAIAWEAIQRVITPAPVASATVLWVAAIGIAINAGSALLFRSGRHNDLNIRGAFLHLASDAAVSAGVVVTAVAIMVTGWQWIDPAASIAIGAVIAVGTWGLLRSSFDLAVDAVPPNIDGEAVEAYLAGLPGVTEVHDLHIWAMSTTETALTAHLVCPTGFDDELLARAGRDLHERFAIDHPTLQIETGTHACRLAPAAAV